MLSRQGTLREESGHAKRTCVIPEIDVISDGCSTLAFGTFGQITASLSVSFLICKMSVRIPNVSDSFNDWDHTDKALSSMPDTKN